MTKILYVLNSPTPGGMEQHVLDLVSTMTACGYKIYVWCPQGITSEWYKVAGAEVTSKTISWDLDPVYIFALKDFLQSNQIDIVHAHELKAVVNSLLAAFLAGVKIRITHTHTPISEWKIHPLVKKLNSTLYALLVNLFATKEIALTVSRKAIKITEGMDESKIHVIANCVDDKKYLMPNDIKKVYRKEILDKFGIPENAYVFGCVSRLSQEKGHATLIQAFNDLLQLKDLSKELFLILVGGGKYQKDYEDLIATSSLSSKVFISGVFPDTQKVKYYNSFDAFVFPSLAEGFGIVMIEAMAAGLPVISSDLPVLQEVGGSTVWYFDAGNYKSLSQKMYDLYLKRANLTNLQEAALTRVKALYTIEKFTQSYVNLYTELLK